MKERLRLDVSGINNIETFHEYVSEELNFPDYYGCKLNAFWDCIPDEDQSEMPKTLIVEGLATLKKQLPELHDGFVKCLEEYAKEYPDRKVICRQGSRTGKGIELEKK